MRNKYSCKSEFVWNVHIKVMLKVISISILDQHAWACWDMVARGIVFLNSQTDSQMYTFPDQKNSQFVQILMNSKFQSKRVLGTDDVKQKTSLFSVQEKPAWYVFMVFCSFVLCHLCLVHKINTQTLITAILSTYLIHEFIVNVKCRMDGSQRKPYTCLAFDFLIQYSANGICLTSVNMQECHLPLASLKELHFPWLTLKFPDLTYGEWLIFLAW